MFPKGPCIENPFPKTYPGDVLKRMLLDTAWPCPFELCACGTSPRVDQAAGLGMVKVQQGDTHRALGSMK